MRGFEYGQITNPKEFTRGLQELLKSYVDREATKNYQRIIPSQILENFMEFHYPF